MTSQTKRLCSMTLSAFMAFGLVLSAPWPMQALVDTASMPNTSRDDAPEGVKTAVSNLIYAFGHSDQELIDSSLQTLKTLSENEWYPIYDDVVTTWTYIENEMPENIGQAPADIADPAHHCFIVLGFALNDDGTMTDELIGRLQVAKASLDEYPEARVLVTGGVEKNGWTEGVRMHDWLVENGIDDGRIYIENKAPDTAGNATNSFEILYNDTDVNSW